MRKISALLLALALLLASFPAARAATVVVFDDPVLEAALRKAANKPEGDVTDRDLAKITSLIIERGWEQNPDPATQVRSITALQYCAKLNTLWLCFQDFSDVSPLAKLTKLHTLEIGGNPIADISPLAKLTSLSTLTLYNCQAADYSVLSKFKNLTSLYLDFSTIADAAPLAKLTKLRNLSLRGTRVADVSPLSKLTALRQLYLAECPVVDYAPLSKIYPKLTDKDFDPSAPPRLRVSFDDPVLENILRKQLGRPDGDVFEDELATLTYVGTGLNYEREPQAGTRVVSVEALRHCVNLTGLELMFNQIADISPLSGLTKLTELRLGGNPITDVRPLAGLTNLASLSLFNAQAGDYSALSNLTNLTELSLSFADISDISPLSGLTNLTSLSLAGTRVTDVSPLAGLTNLRALHLQESGVMDFSPIAGILPGLTETDFDPQNPVTLVAFTDPALEALIRSALNKPEGPVTDRQAARLGDLFFEYQDGAPEAENIRDLSALRYCTGLKQLTLMGVAATDLSPLSALTRLDSLNLQGSRAEDYAPLSSLTNLVWLDLTGAAIRDAAPLANLSKLQALSLRFTGVSDLSPLAGLQNLMGLTLEGAPVRDYSPLAAIYPNIEKRDFLLPEPGAVRFFDPLLEERVRNAMGKPQGDITPQEAAAVTALDLSQDENLETSITSLQGLEAFTGLTKMTLSGNTRLTSLWPLAGLNLEKLNCWKCDIQSLEPLRGMTNLTELSLGWRGNIGSLDALSGLKNLYALDAKGVGITDVGGLAGLPSLVYAGLNQNFIRDFTPLASCPALREVELAGNLTEDYSPLAPMYDRLEIKDFTLDGLSQPQSRAGATESGDGWAYDAAARTLYVDTEASMLDFNPVGDPETATQNDAPWGTRLAEAERIVVGDAVARVGNYAFAFAGKLKEITVGRGVRSLGQRCLYRCGFASEEGLEIVIRCDEMPRLEEDFLGYTWDSPDTILVSSLAQAGQWLEVLGQFPMRIAVK